MAKKISKAQAHLSELEKQIKEKGVHLAYERMQFAGLVLSSGLCWFKGNYYLFVDLRKKVRERIEHLEGALEDLARLEAQGRLDRPWEEHDASDTETVQA